MKNKKGFSLVHVVVFIFTVTVMIFMISLGINKMAKLPRHVLVVDQTSSIGLCAVGTNQTNERVMIKIENPFITNNTWFVMKDGKQMRISDPNSVDNESPWF